MGVHFPADPVPRPGGAGRSSPAAIATCSIYPYRENFRYTLQRGTGVIAFVFILWHVFHMRGWFETSGGSSTSRGRWAGDVRSARRRRPPRPRPSRPPAGRRRLRRGHPGQRLPLGQRPVDDGHHLGRLDQSARPALGQLPCAARRRARGRRRWRDWWECSRGPRLARSEHQRACRDRPVPQCCFLRKEVETWRNPSVMIVGGGLAGMAAAIKLAELDCDVSVMSLAAAASGRIAAAPRAASTASTT